MRFGVALLGALFLAGGIVIGQARPDLYSLERKLQDAQVALDNSVPTSADQREFRDLQDDVAYLRVKTRRGETVSERERREVSDRIDRFINRLTRNSESSTWNQPPPRPAARDRSTGSGRSDRTIPSGTELDVRLETRFTRTPLRSRTGSRPSPPSIFIKETRCWSQLVHGWSVTSRR